MKTNTPKEAVYTHEGAVAQRVSSYAELRRSVLTCILWENTFYEKGSKIAERIAELVPKIEPNKVAALAVEARVEMKLRHVPLFLVRELARIKGNDTLVADTLEVIIQRPDELTEYCSLYWKEKRQPLSAGSKRGLARAFKKFNVYQLAKWNRDGAVKLRDVLFITHACPKDEKQAEYWKELVENKLAPPDTWEVALSAGKDKKATWERLLQEDKLGGMAVLMNLRNMLQVGVDEVIIRGRLMRGCDKALPFRFVTAARYAPTLEDALEVAMLAAVEDMQPLGGETGVLVDVSGSMYYNLSARGETTRMDAACGLAILLRELGVNKIATFSRMLVECPPRRGFALRDAIQGSQDHTSTYLRSALEQLRLKWSGLDRIIVITDEQSQDGILQAFTPKAYVVNVAPYKNGLSYGSGWTHIDGWSERVVDYIRAVELES